jgi:phenylacetate-CoA ligase
VNSLLKATYDRLPISLQQWALTLQGFQIRFERYGRDFHPLLSEALQRERLSAEEMHCWQGEQLRRLLTHALTRVPYYRELGRRLRLSPADFKSPEDLHQLPILTREAVRENFSKLIAEGVNPRRLWLGHTSGTTGTPLEFYWDKSVVVMTNVVLWRHRQCAGFRVGAPFLKLTGNVIVPLGQRTPPYWRLNRALNQLFLSAFHLSEDALPHYVQAIRQFRPLFMDTYPSTAYILARYLASRNETIPLQGVFTSSETLHPIQREVIEQAFACKVFDYYGLAEKTVFATECEMHSGHHVNLDYGILELVNQNGSVGNPGQAGRIVTTGLHNWAMPLIRYETSDITALSPAPCSCGRSFPLMEAVTTKAEDIVVTPDGRHISPSVLTHPFKPMHNIQESQIIQLDPNRILVKIIQRPEYTDADTRQLLTGLRERLGTDVCVELEFVSEIPREPSGKFRWVISHVPLGF